MSCENAPDSTESVMPRRRRVAEKGICIKCKTNRGRIIIRHAVYCKECFPALIKTKFRGVLDPTVNPSNENAPLRGSLKAAGNLLIGYSGGLGSTVLLDLLRLSYLTPVDQAVGKGGKQHPKKGGKPWNRLIICYIECGGAYPDAADRTAEVEAALESYKGDFEFLPLRLEDAFLNGDDAVVDLSNEDLPVLKRPSAATPLHQLKAYLSSLPTATSHQSAISTLIRLILHRSARAHDCSHLVLGTSLTSLSVSLINAVAGGAGYTIGMEKGEELIAPDGGIVRLVRPLREVTMKECAAYLRWRNLSVIGNKRMLSTPSNGKESIGSLTKDFIFGLERDYPSTVSAIVRTCNKLVSNTTGEKPAQPGIREWKERISIRNALRDNEEISTDAPLEPSDTLTEDSLLLSPYLCYACHTTLISRSSRGSRKTSSLGDQIHQVPLPMWVSENLQASGSRQRRQEMKGEIQEFLLDADDATN
ncbi:hypothetical protein BU17DRAFT_74271 [Hysterangium stoloniferum]|nr:hypothetical protein BU17DRAFT_74271 [Hysterangium stoloniferum]